MSVPTPPLISVRPRVTSTTLEFWWAPPASPNGTITGYTLSCISPSSTQTYSGTTGYAKLTGLTNGTDYAFTIVATNATGNSAPAAFRTVRTSAKPAAVATLTKTQTVTNGVLSCTFSWTNPGGDYAYYYVIGIHAAAGTKDYIYRGTRDYTTLSYTIGGLDPTQLYTFHVQRGNDAGYSIKTNITTAKAAAFDPRTVTGLQAWYDAADTAGNGSTVADGTSIATWVDKSGNGRNASAAGGSSTLQTDAVGRKLNLNGTTNRYNLPTGSWSQGQPFTVFSADSSTTETHSTLIGGANTTGTVDGFSTKYVEGNGIWLIGTNGIAYSLDGGFSWKKSPTAAAIFPAGVTKIAWNGSIFVAVGVFYTPGISQSSYPCLAYSYDGINWLQSYSGNNAWGRPGDVNGDNSLATNGSLWLAAGYSGTSVTIVRTNDGINWVTDISGSAIFNQNTKFAYNPNTSMWVALASSQMYYSYDASTWTPSPSGIIFQYGPGGDLAFHGTTWVAVNAGTAYSFDGINWTVSNSANTVWEATNLYLGPVSVATNGSMWVGTGVKIGGASFSIAYSYDGINWQPAETTQPIFNTGAYGQNRAIDVAWNGSYWIAIGSQVYNQTMAISYDGVTWTELVSHSDYYIPNGMNAIIYAPTNGYNVSATATKKIWVAGGDNGGSGYGNSITYSFDGMNWLASPSDKNGYAVSFTLFSGGVQMIATDGKGFWVAGGSGSNRLAYSTDGIFWTVSTSGNAVFTWYCLAAAYNGSNLWVAGGQGTNQLAYSSDGINWTASASGNALLTGICNAVAWNGSNLWVAGGWGTNQMAYSSDGITWTASASAIFTDYCSCVAWNGTRWVAGGGNGTNMLAYSSDGIDWTVSTSGNSVFTTRCNAVTWNGSMWVAGGIGTNQLAYSYDGINWTASTSGNAVLTTEGRAVAWNGSQWIASGNGTNYLASSTDGINWKAITSVTQFYASIINSIVAGVSPTTIQAPVPYTVKAKTTVPAANTSYTTVTKNIWLAGNSVLSYSYDGINWAGSSSAAYIGNVQNGTGAFSGLATNGTNLWVGAIYGGANRLAYSSDGINWSGSTSGNALLTADCRTVAYNGSNRWVAGGAGTNQIIYSSNGITWTASTSGNSVFTTFCTRVAYGGSKWVAGGTGTNQMAYSSDGITWTASTSGNAVFTTTCYALAYNGSNLWVAGGQGTNQMATSSDGETWTASTSGNAIFTSACFAVAYNGTNKWVAGGQGTNQIAYSSDGDTWTASASGNAIFNVACCSVAWHGSLWVAGGDGTEKMAYSSDGETWTVIPGSGRCYSIAYGPSVQTIPVFTPTGQRLIASGQSGEYYQSYTAYSDDGIAWTLLPPGPWTRGTYSGCFATNGSMWVVAGPHDGGLGYSTDGIHWHNALSSADLNSGNVVATNGSMWVAGGEQGTNKLVYSYDGLRWFGLASANALITNSCYTIVYNGTNKWVAGGNGTNTLIYSSDGINWTASASGTALFTGFCKTVAYNGTNKWVAGGNGTNTLIYSSDGINWTASTSGNAIFTDTCGAVAWNGTKWVAGGYGTNTLAYSSDGETWTASTNGNSVFIGFCISVAWNGTKWVAGGSGTNSLAYSTDGDTWTGSTSGNTLFTTACWAISYGFYRDLPTPTTYTSPSQIKADPVNITSISADAIRTLSLDKQIMATDDASTALVDSNLSIGAVKGTTDFYAGGMREVLIYTGSLADSDKAAVTDYLASKWAAPPLTLVPSIPVRHGLTQWLDATDITTLFQDTAGATPVTSNADPVRLWKDKSGNGADLTGAGSLNAKYTASDINTRPGIDCSGALLTSASIPTTSDLTVLIVLKNTVNAADTPFSIWSHQSMTIGGNFPNTYLSGFPLDNTTIKAPYVLSRPTIYTATIGKGQITTLTEYDLSGTAQFSTVGVAMEGFTLAQIQLGLQSAGATAAGVLSVGEVIYYQRVLTDAEISTMVSYLKLKWGITPPAATNLTDNLQVWLDASDPYTVFTSGSAVTAWKDRTGRGNHATPVASPTYSGNGVVFNGTSQYFNLPNGSLPSGDSPYSYYAVTKFTDLSGYGIMGGGATTNNYGRLSIEAFKSRFIVAGGTNAAGQGGGPDGGLAYSYDDGVTWTLSVPIPSTLLPANTIPQVIGYNGSIWVCGTQASITLYSYDGIVWNNAQNNPFTSFNGIAWNGSMWIGAGYTAGSSTGHIAFSYDGVVWYPSVSGNALFTATGTAVAATGSGFAVAGGANSGGDILIAYSSDGFTWTSSASGSALFTTQVAAIATNGTKWVAVGAGTNQLAYSSNGQSWTASTSGNALITTTCYAVATNGTTWVAGGWGTNILAYSSDGETWTASTSGNALFSGGICHMVAWNGTVWVAGAQDAAYAVIYSTDGINWTGSLSSVTTLHKCFCAASTCVLPSATPAAVAFAQTSMGPSNIIVAGGSGTNQLAYSYDGLRWTVSTSGNSMFGSACNSVAWNGSMWVAGGSGTNQLAYSYDGITWIVSSSGNSVISSCCYALGWGGSKWVACGYGTNTLAYSSDGITWNGSASGTALFTNFCRTVAYNGTDKWVAGGNGDNKLAYSSDGETWTASTSGNSIITNTCIAVACNGTKWVAAGYGTNTLAYSNDGETWTASANGNSVFTNNCTTVAWNGTIWVAGGSGTNQLVYSSDGDTWTASSSGNAIFTEACDSVAWAGSLWVAGGTRKLAYSSDGINWTASTSVIFTAYCNAIASQRILPATTVTPGPDRTVRGSQPISLQTTVTSTTVTPSVPGSKFLVACGRTAVGPGGVVAYSNDNGATWTASASGSALFTTKGWRSAYNGTKWVMGGEGDNRLAYSSDGIAWTASASGNTKFTTVVYGVAWNGSNLWVAVGSGTNKLAYSSDGETWTESASGNTQMDTQGNAVAWNGTMWVAGGQNATNPVAYSRDGMNWYGAPTSSILGGGCMSLAWNGSVWVAGSSSVQTMVYSYDGIVWMAAYSPFTSTTYALSFNGTMFVAGGNGTNQLAYSYDGINWTVSTSGNALIPSACGTVAWTGDTWFAGGEGSSIAYSTDGINWTASTTGSAMFTGGNCGGIASNMVLPIQRIRATSSSPSNFLVESLYASGNPMTQYMNASLDATDSALITHAQLTTNNTVGKTPSGKYMKGSIYEIMVYNVAHTALQRQQVEAYLLGKWVQPAYTPALASFAPTLWLESADTTNLTMSGSDILVWKDKSGRGVDLTPTVTSCYPQYAYDPVTMKYGVLFGSKGYTTGLTNALLNIYAPTTISSSIFFVARFNNTNRVNTLYITPVAGQTSVPFVTISNGQITRRLGTGGYIQLASMSNPTQPFIGNLNIVNTGGGYPQADLRINTIVINGEANGTAGNLSGASKIVLGSNNTASPIMTNSEGLNGYIFEYVVFPYCLDAASGIFATPETRKVEGYLAWKWGLEGSLPSSHPYKYRAP